ncbi:MAG: hypothetical protein GX956_03785 [Firmicutes bacterium]|nr:hypothetical protein [Bacillota bacterium]
MEILAVVTLDQGKVGGGAPIFYAQDREELTELAFLLSRVLGASVHDLKNDVLVIIRH